MSSCYVHARPVEQMRNFPLRILFRRLKRSGSSKLNATPVQEEAVLSILIYPIHQAIRMEKRTWIHERRTL